MRVSLGGLLLLLCTRVPAIAEGPMLLGVFPSKELTQQEALQELSAIDAWTTAAGGARTSIAGTFIDLEVGLPQFNVFEQLERAWEAGYTPLVKISAQRTAATIANGAADAGIVGFARGYASWAAQGSGRFAFLAPLPEANYFASAPYTLDPPGFKQAFRRIVDLFEREGVPRSRVRWVFAPNGYTEPGDPDWEEYYPGDPVVDVVGFSQYNWGFCPGSQWDYWLDPDTKPAQNQIFAKYLARMRALAPNRPIFLLQTASTAQSPVKGQIDDARKNEWLRETYAYFADEGVAAVMYFNIDKECDWAFFETGGKAYAGYRDAARDPRVRYVAPHELSTLTLPSSDGCVATSNVLCLQGGRFRVEARWLDSNTGETRSAGVADAATGDSGLLYFWDGQNWEILAKVLDGCGGNGNGRFWVYSAAATDRSYSLVVTDTVTGRSRTYVNAQGIRAAPALDAQAFATCGASGFGSGLATTQTPDVTESARSPILDWIDDRSPAEAGAVHAAPAASCVPGPTVACLQGGRFRAEIRWRREAASALEPASRAPAGTGDSNIFTFYGTDNWEILLKVLDGCGSNGNGRFWVFAAAATDREFDIEVTDTATGAAWSAHNPFGVVPQAIADTSAFATCP